MNIKLTKRAERRIEIVDQYCIHRGRVRDWRQAVPPIATAAHGAVALLRGQSQAAADCRADALGSAARARPKAVNGVRIRDQKGKHATEACHITIGETYRSCRCAHACERGLRSTNRGTNT